MSIQTSKLTSTTTATFEHGAEWVRVDFHLHTKADKEFSHDGAPDHYNSNYVDAMEKAGIRLGIITNHNKFDFEEFKSLRSTARKKGIGLLSGVELSVNDGANGIHTLVVFSEAWLENGQDQINPFLTIAFEGKTPAQYEQENGRSSLSLLDTIKKLEGYHRDFFLIFAHVEQNGGLWVELDGGRIEELGKNEYFRRRTLGFQKVRTHDGAGKNKLCRTKTQEWLKDWYPAEVEGSDPKHIDEIGKGEPYCYLKLGELSFDAVKFALGDPASRVAQEPPKRTTSCIRSIQFEGGVFNDKTIRFSPELNTLIGIRGSGKSSLLEAIRYVLDIPRGEKAQDAMYKDDLVKHTLGSGGKVTLEACDTHGQNFVVSRIYGEAPNVYVDAKLQPGISIRETVIRRPIYFGQKDLSSTGEGFETDLVEKLVGEKLKPLRAQISSKKGQVREAVKRFLGLTKVEEQKREFQQQLEDATFQLRQFEKHGVAEKLTKRVGFDRDASTIKGIRERVQGFVDGLNSFLAEHEDDLRNATAYDSAQNPQFFADYFADYAQIIDQLDRLKQVETDTRTAAGRLDERQRAFDSARQGLQEEFAQIERQLAEELQQKGVATIRPDDFLQLQQRKTKAEQMLEVLTKQESQKETTYNALLREIDQLNQLWLEEFNTIKGELDRVNDNHTSLQIESEFKGEKEAALKFMQELFRGSNLRENTLWLVLRGYADFGGLFRDFEKAKSRAGSMPDVFERYFLQNLPDLVTWQVPNRFVIRYRGKELKNHSLGQRASALILYVLSQRQNDVIIIDQPEDDLDNQTIYDDVIKLIREMKSSTQFIFATHNANFPVLGDAEQVHACRYQDGKATVQSGSIDARPIQEAIINIMEGGEEAFNKRKEVYNLWKPQNSSR